jgi:DNA adenine methylase
MATQTIRVLRWHGGKGKLAPKIVPLLPKHHTYIEPFGGAAAVLLEKQPSEFEVYNDINSDLVNFFRMLREAPEDLIRAIELTPYAREEYAVAGGPVEDPVERARRFMVASWMTVSAYTGTFRSETDWRRLLHYTKGTHNPPSVEWQRLSARLWGCSQRLRTIQIDNRPAKDIIVKYDGPGACFYIDPPYMAEVRTGPKRYEGEMTDDEHVELLELLNGSEGAQVVSSYDNPLYAQQLTRARGWVQHKFEMTLHSTMAGLGQKRHTRVESVWVRAARAPSQTTLSEAETWTLSINSSNFGMMSAWEVVTSWT